MGRHPPRFETEILGKPEYHGRQQGGVVFDAGRRPFHMFRALPGPGLVLGLGLLVLSPAFGLALPQQPPAAAVNPDTLGPQVGDTLPDFNLGDQGGRARSLKSLLGPNGAVIVFYRSADW
jgi:hypothetical protein